MPGTPATAPRTGAPRYANGDGVNFAGQVNAVTDAFDAVVALLTDPRFTDQRVPTDGSVGNSKVASNAAIAMSKLALAITNGEVAANAAIAESKLALASDAAPGTASRRTLGTGPNQAAAGNDPRFGNNVAEGDSRLFQVGDLKLTALAAAPAGWLICNGALVSQSTYAALYTALGGASSPYGVSGASFYLPDLRDRVPVGVSGTIARGATGGAKQHSLTTGEMPPHQHTFQQSSQQMIASEGTDLGVLVNNKFAQLTSSEGGGASHNNMQPYVGMNYLIKT